MMTPEQAQAILAQPAREEVEELLRTDVLRAYRIDIETDSTVRADLTRAQENMSKFIEGAGGFIQAMAPVVQSGLVPPDVATDLFAGFARVFKLGKQAEDALDRMGQMGKKLAQEGLPQPPNPEMEKVALEKDKAAREAAVKDREMAMAEGQQQRDHEYRMAQEGTKAAQETTKQQDGAVKAQAEKEARDNETLLQILTLLQQVNDGEENRGLEREKITAQREMNTEKLADTKEGRMMERKDKLAERTGDVPDDLGEGNLLSSLTDAIKELGRQQLEGFAELRKIMLAPAVLERDKNGRPVGARRVLN